MANGDSPKPLPIENLPIEAQVPVLVREHMHLVSETRHARGKLEARLGNVEVAVTKLAQWKAWMMGAIAVASGSLGVAATKLFGG